MGQVASQIDVFFGGKGQADEDFSIADLAEIPEKIDEAIVTWVDWCKDNNGDCALATADWIPYAGTIGRCTQLAVQSVDGDVGQDTAFNCELNLASDALPVAGKLAARGVKAAKLGVKGGLASRRLANAETALRREGLTQAEREAAFQELQKSREAYAAMLTAEMESQEKLMAKEADALMAKEADAIAEKSEWDTMVTGWREAEEHAAEITARDNKISRLLKEGQLQHAAELEEEAALQLASREADNLAAKVAEKDLAAAEKGVVANAKKLLGV